jgi:purine-binding chemotaxis protein CheW
MTTAEVERQLVVFSLHGEHYGLPITSVREIIRYVPPSATAAATGLVQGLINLRGRTLPIVDLSSRLGRSLEVGTKTRILIVEVPEGALGLVVDNVDGILPIPAEQIERLPVAAAENVLGDEVAAVGEGLIVLIDTERAFGEVLAKRPKPRRRAPQRTARQSERPAAG